MHFCVHLIKANNCKSIRETHFSQAAALLRHRYFKTGGLLGPTVLEASTHTNMCPTLYALETHLHADLNYIYFKIFWIAVLVYSRCCTKYHVWVAYTQQKLISLHLEAAGPRSGCPHGQVPGCGSSELRTAVSHRVSSPGERGLFLKALISFLRAPPSRPNHPQRPQLLIPSPWGRPDNTNILSMTIPYCNYCSQR